MNSIHPTHTITRVNWRGFVDAVGVAMQELLAKVPLIGDHAVDWCSTNLPYWTVMFRRGDSFVYARAGDSDGSWGVDIFRVPLDVDNDEALNDFIDDRCMDGDFLSIDLGVQSPDRQPLTDPLWDKREACGVAMLIVGALLSYDHSAQEKK